MTEQLENLQTLIVHSAKYKTNYTKKYLNRKKWEPVNPNHLISFIPGTVLDVLVKEGDKVKAGQNLMILEAMKMHNQVLMPFDGEIVKVNVEVGAKIPKNFLMMEIRPI
jgi:pyruvate carboxylase